MRSFRSLAWGVQGARRTPALMEAGGVTALVMLALWQFDRWDGVPLGPPARDAGAVLALAAAGVATAAAVGAALGPAGAEPPKPAGAGPPETARDAAPE